MPWWRVKDSICFILPFQRSFSLWGIAREQKPEPELGKKVRARYAWEVRPEFLFCVWHAVRILLGQGPCYHLAELMVSSPLLFADVVVRTSVKWQCHCRVLAKPGLPYEKTFWWHEWDVDFCFLIRNRNPPPLPSPTPLLLIIPPPSLFPAPTSSKLGYKSVSCYRKPERIRLLTGAAGPRVQVREKLTWVFVGFTFRTFSWTSPWAFNIRISGRGGKNLYFKKGFSSNWNAASPWISDSYLQIMRLRKRPEKKMGRYVFLKFPEHLLYVNFSSLTVSLHRTEQSTRGRMYNLIRQK